MRACEGCSAHATAPCQCRNGLPSVCVCVCVCGWVDLCLLSMSSIWCNDDPQHQLIILPMSSKTSSARRPCATSHIPPSSTTNPAAPAVPWYPIKAAAGSGLRLVDHHQAHYANKDPPSPATSPSPPQIAIVPIAPTAIPVRKFLYGSRRAAGGASSRGEAAWSTGEVGEGGGTV